MAGKKIGRMKDIIKQIIVMAVGTAIVFGLAGGIYFVFRNSYQNYLLSKAKTEFFNRSVLDTRNSGVYNDF